MVPVLCASNYSEHKISFEKSSECCMSHTCCSTGWLCRPFSNCHIPKRTVTRSRTDILRWKLSKIERRPEVVVEIFSGSNHPRRSLCRHQERLSRLLRVKNCVSNADGKSFMSSVRTCEYAGLTFPQTELSLQIFRQENNESGHDHQLHTGTQTSDDVHRIRDQAPH